MVTSQTAEYFRDLLLRHRGRSGLTQRQLADRVGIHRRSVQEWELGATYPSAERLEALIRALLEVGGLSAGHETEQAQALWSAVQCEAPRIHAPFDTAWFAQLLAQGATPAPTPPGARASSPSRSRERAAERSPAERRQEWGEAPDTTSFVGRTDELVTLSSWVVEEHCRLMVILGMGGIGKTSLAARLAYNVALNFERVYWRSLRDAPLPSDWLAGAIAFLSDQQLVPPAYESQRLTAVLQLLRRQRCLLVLDNLETLFEPGQPEGRYREGLAGYGRLLQAVGEASHQSCLVLTSREAPPELTVLGGDAVRTFSLGGLGVEDAEVLLAPKQLAGTNRQWAELTARFGGNGLALKLIGERIRELYGGDLGGFLEEAGAGTVFGGIRRLLAEQVERSSALEHQVLRALAVAREPVPLATLMGELGPSSGRGAVLEAVEALRRRSLVERAETSGAAAFTLQSVVLEYVTDRLVEAVADEIEGGEPEQLIEQPLIQAQTKDYLRQSQERLIGAPILNRLEVRHEADGIEQRLLTLLERWRGQPAEDQGYGPGNVVNLRRLLRGHLRGLDGAGLSLRQVYLAGLDMQDASLAGAQLGEAALTEAFDHPTSAALSADGLRLAVGTATGQLYLWRVADRVLLLSLQGHSSGVHGLALSQDGLLLASSSEDGTAKLWETGSGQLRAVLRGHSGGVPDVALSTDGQLVASGGMDCTVRLWAAVSGQPLATLEGHTGLIRGVALSADGQLVASGGDDGTVRLWDSSTGRPLATLEGHTGLVRGVALSADGQLVASGGDDGAVRLWEAPSGQLVAALEGHTGPIYRVAFSTDRGLVASASHDGRVKLWDTRTGQLVLTLDGHTAGVRSVALDGDGRLLASASHDGTVKLWEAPGGRLVLTLEGYTAGVRSVALDGDGRLLASASHDGTVKLWDALAGQLAGHVQAHSSGVWRVALSADGRLVASSSEDGMVKLWDAASRRLLATLQGHAGPVWGVALSADGRLVASSSEDGTVKLWESASGQLLSTLHGHASAVWSVALSADGGLAASSSDDGAVKLWATCGGRLLATLEGHAGPVYGVALSADGRLLASASFDGTVRLWAAPDGRPLATLEGHTGLVQAVALSADGRLLASASFDRTVRLWAAPDGRPLATLEGHTGPVFGVALSANGHLLVSGGLDGTVRLWEASTGASLRTLRADRRYERLNITGLSGITPAQRSALLTLGAFEKGV
jgi:WD40 repeat protein/transcriptional regulator with XRE-family HTH domain